MAVRETPAEHIERLLNAQDPVAAARVAGEILEKAPMSFLGNLGRCRAYFQLGRVIEAERALDLALSASPNDARALFLRAMGYIRHGLADTGIARLRSLTSSNEPIATEAMLALLDVLYQTNQGAELTALVGGGGVWAADPRASIHRARVEALTDPASAAQSLRTILRSALPLPVRRIAGFEAAGHLDKLGDYRAAFDIARETHTTTDGDFDIDGLLRPLQAQRALVEKGVNWITPRAPRVEGVAMIVSLPRSGTTLLEHMLDRHPAISGIGEFDGVRAISVNLDSTGRWPRAAGSIPPELYAYTQALYLEGSHRIRRPGASWTFDKSLRTWRALPEIAAVLPGAVCISVDRDPRDLATSAFLSYFASGGVPWTASFSSMRRVIEAQRALGSRAMQVLNIAHESIIYEDLVKDPAKHAARCLALMNLPMDPRVLSPEENTRAAITLSALQVRKPINRSSIGRWKNYEWAFDSSWDALVNEHASKLA